MDDLIDGLIVDASSKGSLLPVLSLEKEDESRGEMKNRQTKKRRLS
jgi:hypothetical protein